MCVYVCMYVCTYEKYRREVKGENDKERNNHATHKLQRKAGRLKQNTGRIS